MLSSSLTNAQDLAKKLHQLKLLARKLSLSSLSGDYITAFKGSGFEFHQLREYHDGDDVRLIDWKGYAKTGNILVKELLPERDRTIVLAVDCSKSMQCGSHKELKIERALQIATALSLIAQNSKDKVALLLFSDRILSWLPPQKGMIQFNRILEQLCFYADQGVATMFQPCFDFLLQLKIKRSPLFIISDWFGPDINKTHQSLASLGRKYELTCIQVNDPGELKFPAVGMLQVEDPETGELYWLDTDSPDCNAQLQRRNYLLNKVWQQNHIESWTLPPNQDLVYTLTQYLGSRKQRRR